tara:strand:+ start:2318 stop:2716 length:399 start_codon:yes stop_codon:yes gene_type:complete
MPVKFKNHMPKKRTDEGIHTYEGSEIANIGLGQNGFDIIGSQNHYVEEDGTLSGTLVGNWTRGWVMIKAIGGAVTGVEGTSNSGDHLTLDGSAPSGSNGITIADTDVVFGNFKKIIVKGAMSAAVTLICYRG